MTPSKTLSRFAYAKSFTPILNTQNYLQIFGGNDGKTLPLDSQGLIRQIETIAFPHTKFEIVDLVSEHILQVNTSEYSYGMPLFVDQRFLITTPESPSERSLSLLSSSSLLEKMRSLLGTRYLWGGNCLGVPDMLSLYPPAIPITDLDEGTLRNWTLQGLDCSGLIYFVTEGFTPRNTSSWVTYGHPVKIENMTLEEILSQLRPLDAIVWPGHILFVKDNQHSIESLAGHGVVLFSLEKRLLNLIEEKKMLPKNDWDVKKNEPSFVIRRWHPDSL